MRILLGALAGALVVFVVSAILHMATPLGAAGFNVLPNEEPMLQAMRDHVPQSGLYMVPGLDMRSKPTEEQMNAFAEKLRRGPSALLVYTAGGADVMAPRQLILEFLTVFCAALIGAWLLSRIGGSYLLRASVIALLAVFTFFATGASHWIWYHFPTAFALAELGMETIGWFLGGLAMAKIIRPPAAVA